MGDYTISGFDGFLSRSVDSLPQVNLDSTGPVTTQRAFDRGQASGSLGDTVRIGNIHLNGADDNIILSDGNNERLLLGRQNGGF